MYIILASIAIAVGSISAGPINNITPHPVPTPVEVNSTVCLLQAIEGCINCYLGLVPVIVPTSYSVMPEIEEALFKGLEYLQMNNLLSRSGYSESTEEVSQDGKDLKGGEHLYPKKAVCFGHTMINLAGCLIWVSRNNEDFKLAQRAGIDYISWNSNSYELP